MTERVQKLMDQVFPNQGPDEMYLEFEEKYNPYPVQMSRAAAFENARKDGLITDQQYNMARWYFGKLWFYVGD